MRIIALLLLISFNLLANRLLVISSGEGMYGSADNINIAIEQAGASLVEEQLKESYSKVYKVVTATIEDSVTDEIKRVLSLIVSEAKPGERLDVFTMQHGPDGTPFDGVSIAEAKKILPYGFVRNVYGTNCSEFGDVAVQDNKNYVIEQRNEEFAKELESIGVDTYLHHTNTNSTGFFTLPLMLKNLKTHKSWITAGIETYKEFDQLMTRFIPSMQGLTSNERFYALLPDLHYVIQDWEDIITSRLVIGTKNKNEDKRFKDLLSVQRDDGEYSQKLVKMTEAFENIIRNDCESGLSEYKTICEKDIEETNLNKLIMSFVSQVHYLFDAYDTSDRSCLPGVVLNKFTSQMGYDVDFKELCLVKKNEQSYKLKWKLNKESIFSVKTKVEIDQVEELRSMALANKGSVVIKVTKKDKLIVKLTGVKLLINGIDGKGKLKGITKLKPKGINILSDGSVEGRVKVLGIPLTVGADEQDITTIGSLDFFRLLGFKINI